MRLPWLIAPISVPQPSSPSNYIPFRKKAGPVQKAEPLSVVSRVKERNTTLSSGERFGAGSERRVGHVAAEKGQLFLWRWIVSGTLVEWNAFSREIKPCFALLCPVAALSRINPGKLVPTVIMVRRISPINLIVSRPGCSTQLSSPLLPSPCLVTSSLWLELLHVCDSLKFGKLSCRTLEQSLERFTWFFLGWISFMWIGFL